MKKILMTLLFSIGCCTGGWSAAAPSSAECRALARAEQRFGKRLRKELRRNGSVLREKGFCEIDLEAGARPADLFRVYECLQIAYESGEKEAQLRSLHARWNEYEMKISVPAVECGNRSPWR